MKSIHKVNFFDSESFNMLKEVVLEKISKENDFRYGADCTRYYKVVFFPTEIHNMLLEKAKHETGDDSLEIIYSQIVRYQIKDGIVPSLRKHKDVANGEWVMDVVVDATIDWPLIIEGESFSNVSNSVTFIKGEEELHWRPAFPSQKEEDYVTLLFVHLANKDSKYAKISKELLGMGEERLNSFLRAAVPAWGSYKSE